MPPYIGILHIPGQAFCNKEHWPELLLERHIVVKRNLPRLWQYFMLLVSEEYDPKVKNKLPPDVTLIPTRTQGNDGTPLPDSQTFRVIRRCRASIPNEASDFLTMRHYGGLAVIRHGTLWPVLSEPGLEDQSKPDMIFDEGAALFTGDNKRLASFVSELAGVLNDPILTPGDSVNGR